ncbi:hypothetical protein FUT89_19800, partial [Ralstonia pseudosolanacearum]
RYDAAGQLAQVETDTDRFTYQHDPRGQVTSVSSIRQPAEHYTYNAAQNIAAHGRQGPIDGRHYLPGGLPERVGHTRYRYDARGRTIEKTIEQPGFRPKTWGYEWDGLNRLVTVHTPDKGTWAYRYDAFNRRVEKVNTGTGASVRFVWDGYTVAERWGQKRDGSTGTATTWHFEPDSHTPLAQETDAQHYAVFCNPTGLPLEIYRATGEKVWASRYNLWGQALSEDTPPDDEALDTSLRFAGQWADEESGLHYNLNRYYDPDSGCYLSIDPIAIRGGHRTQGYVQNPLWEVDPLGLAVCSARYARYKALREQGLSPAEAARESKLPELPEGYFYRTTNGGVQVVRSDMGALPKLGITPEGYLYSPLDVSGPYERPSGYRSGVRDEVWENAKQQDGNVYDPLTNKVMDKDEPWDMGHKPGYEFRKFKEKAAERNLTREEFLDEHNNPSHYRPELPSSNRSHAGEDMTDTYLGD